MKCLTRRVMPQCLRPAQLTFTPALVTLNYRYTRFDNLLPGRLPGRPGGAFLSAGHDKWRLRNQIT